MVAITIHRDSATLVDLLRRGVDSVVPHPFGAEQLARSIRAASDNRMGTRLVESFTSDEQGLRRDLQELDRLASADAAIAICGETGTGKSTLAACLHHSSRRRRGPLVSIFPGDMERPEVFGPGGAFHRAGNGTLVIENLQELSDRSQTRIADCLASHEFDSRLIATADRGLEALVRRGQLRRDLAYRLGTREILLPPLRDRLVDLPRLVERIAARLGVTPPAPGELPDRLWRGNLHELTAWIVRYASGVTHERTATVSRPPMPSEEPKSLRELERIAIERSLAAHDGNRTQSARQLGISVRTLRNKIRLYGLA